MHHSRKSGATLLAIAALVFAGCGGDEEEPASSASEPEAAETATLEITASGTDKDRAFELSATEVPAGVGRDHR